MNCERVLNVSTDVLQAVVVNLSVDRGDETYTMINHFLYAFMLH